MNAYFIGDRKLPVRAFSSVQAFKKLASFRELTPGVVYPVRLAESNETDWFSYSVTHNHLYVRSVNRHAGPNGKVISIEIRKNFSRTF